MVLNRTRTPLPSNLRSCLLRVHLHSRLHRRLVPAQLWLMVYLSIWMPHPSNNRRECREPSFRVLAPASESLPPGQQAYRGIGETWQTDQKCYGPSRSVVSLQRSRYLETSSLHVRKLECIRPRAE